MYEIEIKAWAKDPAQTEKNIAKFAEYQGQTEKQDVYWHNDKMKLRIRQETGKPTIVNFKELEINKDGLEVNTEKEFSLGQIEDTNPIELFEIILKKNNFAIVSKKHKITKSWTFNTTKFSTVLIELSEVKRLGYFIEIEILSESNEKSIIDEAHNTLLETLTKCGIPHSDIEPRYYSQMLNALDHA